MRYTVSTLSRTKGTRAPSSESPVSFKLSHRATGYAGGRRKPASKSASLDPPYPSPRSWASATYSSASAISVRWASSPMANAKKPRRSTNATASSSQSTVPVRPGAQERQTQLGLTCRLCVNRVSPSHRHESALRQPRLSREE